MKMTKSTKTRFVAVAATALLIAPLAACSASSPAMPPGTGFADGSGQFVEGGGNFAPGREAVADQFANLNGSVIATGSIGIEAADPTKVADRVTEVVDGLGGAVEARNSSEFGDGTRNTVLSVWVPAKNYDEAFDQLGDLGQVVSENRNALDVTAQQADLSARIEALEEAVSRLRTLAEGTSNVSDLITIEGELSMRNTELQSLKAQYEATAESIDHSRIVVSLSTPVGNSAGPTTFWDGILTGLASIAAAGAGLLVLLGILVPWIALIGIVVFVIVLIRRSSKKRRAKKAAQPAQAEQPERDAAPETAERPEPEAPSAEQK